MAVKNVKNKELAEALDTSSQQVSMWLRTGSILHKNLVAICGFLDMPVSEFIALGED